MGPLIQMLDAGCLKLGTNRASSIRDQASSSIAPVAQLDRAPDFESVGRGFESLRARF